MADMTWQPWWDVAAQRLGPQAWPVIQQLQSVSNTNDWTAAINQAADSLTHQYGSDWQDPSRGSSPQIGAQILNLYGAANPSQASSLQPFEAAFDQQGAAKAAQIQQAQNPPKKGGLFGGGFGSLLGIGGLALGGLGLAGLGPLAGLGGAAAGGGAADLAGAAGAFDAAGIGTGIDAGIMSSTAGLGSALAGGALNLGTTDLGIGQALGPTMGEDVAGAASVGGGAGMPASIDTLTSGAGSSFGNPELTNLIQGLSPGETTGQALGGITAGGADTAGGSLLDWFHGMANQAGTQIANNPFQLGSSLLQYALGQKNAGALKNLTQTIQNTSNPLAQPQRSPFQALALNTAENPVNGPFSDAYLKAGQSLIDANVAKSGNPVNVFAKNIPQIMSGMSGDYNNYLNTLMGYGGFNQGVGSAGSNLASLAPLTAGVNTSQTQGFQQLLGTLSGANKSGAGSSDTGLKFS